MKNIIPLTPFLKGEKWAFTLVELIVVVTILAILWTIGFVSYSSYLTWVRDANRIAQLAAISDGLHLYSTKNTLPNPDDAVNITSDWDTNNTVGYQGYAWTTVLETIDYSKQWVDPKDKTHFTYYLSVNKKHHQLLAFLEESKNLQAFNGFISQAHANLENRYPTVYGKKLWVLTTSDNTPIQEDATIQTAWLVNLSDASTSTYKAYYRDDLAPITWWINLAASAPNASCKRIYDATWARKDRVYQINPTWTSPFNVYCDMTTDGGGWTYATMLADTTTQNLFDTWNTDKITSITSNISSKGTLSSIWTDNENKDIMLVCRTNSIDHKTYEIPTIIYDYLKSDINNLERQDKATPNGTAFEDRNDFSSTELTVKWNNVTTQITTKWPTSVHNTSHYIHATVSGLNYYILPGWNNITLSSGAFQDSPAYLSSASENVNQPLDSDNYCMAAIR